MVGEFDLKILFGSETGALMGRKEMDFTGKLCLDKDVVRGGAMGKGIREAFLRFQDFLMIWSGQ